MVRKTQPEPAKVQRGHIKRRKMFEELETRQERIAQNKQTSELKHPIASNKGLSSMVGEDEEQLEDINNIQLKNRNLGDVCDAVSKLIVKNKINVSNAFNVPIIDLQQLPQFSKTFENDNAWKSLSSTLENDYKIYSYRVDAIHNITYGILNQMARRQEYPNALLGNAVKMEEDRMLVGQGPEEKNENLYLEKNRDSLNIVDIECGFSLNPFLQRTKRKFDQVGLASLLLNGLTINKHLSLQVFRSKQLQQRPYFQPKFPSDVSLYNQEHMLQQSHTLDIFNQISILKQSIGNKWWLDRENVNIGDNFELDSNNQIGGFVEDPQSQEYSAPVEVSQRPISSFIHCKQKEKKKNRILLTDEDVINDGKIWMDDRDRKMTNMPQKDNKKLIKAFKLSFKQQQQILLQIPLNAEDYQSNDILQKQQCKNERGKQDPDELQDKFLLPRRLFTNFNIESMLTLRDDPSERILDEGIIDQQFHPNRQLDLRRQQVSIKETKQRILNLLENRPTFKTIYNNYNQQQCSITPAMCFLTMLHLANEFNLTFAQLDDSDFSIK